MRKLALIIGLLLITSNSYAVNTSADAFLVSSDVTIPHLEGFRTNVVDKLNSFPGGKIQAGTIGSSQLDANANPENRWNEAFNDFVYTGLLPGTGTIATAVITAGTGYVDGVRVVKTQTIPGAGNYPVTKDIYVDLSSSGTFTYNDVVVGASEPSTSANSIRLAKVTTNGTDVTTVEDKRVMNITDSTYEDFYIRGMELITISPDVANITVDAGLCHVGTYVINKTAQTTLTFATAGDWWDGVADTYAAAIQGNARFNYVGMDISGNIKFLGANAPNRADTSGNTDGKLRYYYDGTKYWKTLGAVTMTTSNALALHFKQRGDWVYFLHTNFYDAAQRPNPLTQILYGQSNSIFTTVNVSNDVPAFGNMINIDLYSTGVDYLCFAVDSNNTGRGITPPTASYNFSIYNIPISSQEFQFLVSGVSVIRAYCAGYYLGDIR